MPRTRRGSLWRAAVATLIVIGCTAATTAVAGLLKLDDIAHDFGQIGAITGAGRHLVVPSPGAPQTLLLIGVDKRPNQGSGPGNTDTMMLVRINDSSKTINLLSIPRDLAVDIPGVGVEKLNAAYADGGSRLLLQTLNADVFPGIYVNHIMIVDFQSFANLVTSLGCIYTAVDRRYYNQNDGQSIANNYSSIDIEPGYQKLCGDNGAPNSALAFVRFRHNDSDLVRESRQQDFLRWAKSQWTTSELLSNESRLFRNFGKDVQTDSTLHSLKGIDELFGLAVNADGSEIKSFPFPVAGSETVNGGDDLTFQESASSQTYQQFLTPTSATPSVGHTALGTGTARGKGKGKGKGRKRGKALFTLPAGMVPDASDGKSQAAQLGNVGMPIYYPRDIAEGFLYCETLTADCNEDTNPASAYANSYPRSYEIDGPDNERYPAYVLTLVESSGAQTDLGSGQYFNVQGTTWQSPPLLRDPSLIRVVNGKRLDIYSQGGQISTVAWHTHRGVYWIQNTLQNFIGNEQMVAMAATLAPAAK
jgi:polyisoprenyl-teichoic acid--peptidoglycan teichoic acid transferase